MPPCRPDTQLVCWASQDLRRPCLGQGSACASAPGPNPSPCFSSHLWAARGKQSLPFPWFGHIIMGVTGAFGFIILVYLLVNCQYIGPW